MSDAARHVLAEALRLPVKERADLAAQLLRSLDDEEREEAVSPDEWQRVWTAEIEKRMREIREGKVALIDGDEVFREIQASLKPTK